jgi:hypothetical protein
LNVDQTKTQYGLKYYHVFFVVAFAEEKIGVVATIVELRWASCSSEQD